VNVYVISDADKVIAHGEADAWAVWTETTGMDPGEEFSEDPDEAIQELPADKVLRIICDADGNPSDDGETISRTCAEWVAHQGRGFLCSTEY
jgi:hypothetical protein